RVHHLNRLARHCRHYIPRLERLPIRHILGRAHHPNHLPLWLQLRNHPTPPTPSALASSAQTPRTARITAAAPAMSYFIFSMPSAGLIEIPPVSKVIPLPTSPNTGAPSAGFVAGSYVITISAGGSAEPFATAQNAFILSSCNFSEE